jgi:hypothetical protein
MLITFIVARLIGAAFLLWALAPHPPGYYQLLRFTVTAICVFGVFCANRWNLHGWIFAFGWLAIFFNPVYSITLPSAAWSVIDVAVTVLLLASLPFVRPNRKILSGIAPQRLKTF